MEWEIGSQENAFLSYLLPSLGFAADYLLTIFEYLFSCL